MLGRASDREVVLTRTLGEKLVAFNPGLPDDAYRDAIASVQSLQHAAGLGATRSAGRAARIRRTAIAVAVWRA